MAKTSKVLATVEDYDINDCASCGYKWTLYADGRVAAVYHTRYMGCMDDARYTTDPGYVDLSEMDDADEDFTALALLTSAVQGIDPANASGWRQTRRGYEVR